MNSHVELGRWLDWLLTHSLQAGVLVVLVLAVQWIFRRRLTNRWRFALWWIVLARLLLPFSPESALSVFNFVRPTAHLERETAGDAASPLSLPPSSSLDLRFPIAENAMPDDPTPPLILPHPYLPPGWPTPTGPQRAGGYTDFLIPCLASLWLGGVIMLCGIVAAQTMRFHRRLTRSSSLADAGLRTLLDDCRREFGVSRQIELLETNLVQSPALLGLRRLCLLLPPGIGAQFDRRELRYIFLHEVAHVKRGDLWLNWLVTALQILHWFNPLLWLGFARLRADRELACDELALLRAGDSAGAAYGGTVVKLLENLSRPAAIPGLVGILEDKQQMRRRIAMIVNFRRPGRWSALAVVLLAVVAAVALTDAQSNQPANSSSARIKVENEVTDIPRMSAGSNTSYRPLDGSAVPQNSIPAGVLTSYTNRPDLHGTVVGDAGGRLREPATVFIATAAPKVGTSTFCPSCYADCVKFARADAQGNFTIPSLDPQLTFKILAVAKGYQPKEVAKVDPASGMPVYVQLQPIESADAAPDRCLHGRVVNTKGEPIAGAVVDREGVRSKDGGGGWGAIAGVDPLAVTDDHGEFLITAKQHYDSMDLKISARTYADKPFTMVPVGITNELVMTEGASLTGRVLLNGKPLAHVMVGVSGTDRQAGSYLGHYEIGTGDDGRFAFVNLPPDADFYLYSCMDAMKTFGAVPVQKIHTGKDGATTDAGDLATLPAHRLAGRVALSDGQPIPATTRLLVSRDQAWDSMQIVLDQNGKFDTAGVPNELVSLSARVTDYHVSSQNRSLDTLNPFELVGRVDRDITNLVFLMDKGPGPQPNYGQVDPDYNESRQRSLHGAEGGVDHGREWTISGHVVDAGTKEPVKAFTVTPGQNGNLNSIAWSTSHAVEGSNGVFTAYINKRSVDGVLKIEADGYLPQVQNIEPGSTLSMDFALKKGSGPGVRVVLPDGSPDTNAAVVMLNSDFNQVRLENRQLRVYRGATSFKVDSDGRFTFKPMWGALKVVAASTNGFGVVSLEALATNSTITLEPYGTVSGILNRPSGPGTNETLDLSFDGGLPPGINLDCSADTDAEGRYKFKNVPSGRLKISYRVMMNNGQGWTAPELQKVDLKPAEALEVNISASARETNHLDDLQPQPGPKIIPGAQVKGVVLLPDGKPATDSDVALQVDGQYLNLGRAKLSVTVSDESLLVHAGPDGSFTLPMCENARAVIAVGEAGYAQVSLDQFKASPQITLQKWGRIEGTLCVGHHVGSNNVITISAEPPGILKRIFLSPWMEFAGGRSNLPVWLQPPFYEVNAFQCRTDERGHFALTFVPPGGQSIWRRVLLSENSWTESPVATVEVKPGETVVTNIGGLGRTVSGRFKASTDDFAPGFTRLQTPTFKYYQAAQKLKTEAEREAYYQSPEVQAALNNQQNLALRIAADGSFRAEDVPPGIYEINSQPNSNISSGNQTTTSYASVKEFTIPEAKDEHDDSIVDLGTVEMEKRTVPIPPAPR